MAHSHLKVNIDRNEKYGIKMFIKFSLHKIKINITIMCIT